MEFFGITFDAHPHSGWFFCLAPNGARRNESHINKKKLEITLFCLLFGLVNFIKINNFYTLSQANYFQLKILSHVTIEVYAHQLKELEEASNSEVREIFGNLGANLGQNTSNAH